MKSHRLAWIAGSMVLAAFFVFQTGWSKADAQVVQLRFAHFTEDTHPLHLGAKQFAARVEERTKGQVKITIYPGNSLGSPPEMQEMIKLGTLDMGATTQGQLEKYVRACMTAQIPFIFDDYDHAHRVLDGPSWPWLYSLAQKEGIILLSNWEWGFRCLTNNRRPILQPDDVKGLKIRVPPEMHLQAAMEALGAIVTKIAFPEVYMALAQNVVDGQENPIPTIYSQKFWEVQKHLALTKHAYSCSIHQMSSAGWAKLNPEQKKIVQEESKSAGEYVRKTLIASEEDLLAKMEKSGVKITRPDLSPFRAKMGPAYEKITKYTGEENVKLFMKWVEDARKK